MSKKVLFVDFDGVLHPTTHGSNLLSQLPLLESAIESHDCALVISSSWRFHLEVDDLKKHFSSSVRNKIVGVTGEAYIGAMRAFMRSMHMSYTMVLRIGVPWMIRIGSFRRVVVN